MNKTHPLWPNGLDAERRATVEAHKAADRACGREWSCQCGTCRAARKALQRVWR